jgi:hypothetical protein
MGDVFEALIGLSLLKRRAGYHHDAVSAGQHRLAERLELLCYVVYSISRILLEYETLSPQVWARHVWHRSHIWIAQVQALGVAIIMWLSLDYLVVILRLSWGRAQDNRNVNARQPWDTYQILAIPKCKDISFHTVVVESQHCLPSLHRTGARVTQQTSRNDHLGSGAPIGNFNWGVALYRKSWQHGSHTFLVSRNR